MRITGMRAAVLFCAAFLIAAVGATSLAGAKLTKIKVRTAVTLNALADPSHPSGKTHDFTGFLDVTPDRRTCLRRDVALLAIKDDKAEEIATANSDGSGKFDLGTHNTKPNESYQAVADRKVKKKKKAGKKIICKRGESAVKTF
jgi:hypothetical protein